LIRFCKQIKSLDISSTNVSDTGLIAISKFGKQCTELSIANCRNITALGLSRILKKNGVALGYLCINGCRQISHECVEQIRSLTPKLKLDAKLEVLGNRIF
jgi:hypothetical protein